MQHLIELVRNDTDLGSQDVQEALALLLSDSIEAKTKAEFLAELQRKGETSNEIANFARAMLERAVPISVPENLRPLMDICGTGGDGIDLFNVSTATIFVLAAGGVRVLKHGNRAVTSRSGSADVLEALGIRIDLGPDDLVRCLQELGFAFVYARIYHPAFRALAEMRQHSSGNNQRTVFSLIGPLLNPGRPERQVMGTFSAKLTATFAEVMRQLGRERAWIVNGAAGTVSIDEVSTMGPTAIAELGGEKISSAILDTRWLGMAAAKLNDLLGGDAKTNAEIITAIFEGKEKGARLDLLVANAAAGFVVAGAAEEMNAGIALAREQISCGGALKKLRELQHLFRSQ